MSYSEANTRKDFIHPSITRGGWDLNDLTQVGIEIPVDGYDAEPWNGVTDYILLREDAEVLAVVEAKKTSHDARLTQQQESARQAEQLFQMLLHQAFRGEL